MKNNIPYNVICTAKKGDEDIRAFIESELVLAIINTYDPYRMPEDKRTKK